MRLLALAAMLLIDLVPALAQACSKPHPSPENPTIVLGLVGGVIVMWQYARAGSGK